uniref:Uncharacterized protein n=1 Tax=Plectus sambesii TaxID=2011161 RepID=A0A914WCI0_9BILA
MSKHAIKPITFTVLHRNDEVGIHQHDRVRDETEGLAKDSRGRFLETPGTAYPRVAAGKAPEPGIARRKCPSFSNARAVADALTAAIHRRERIF